MPSFEITAVPMRTVAPDMILLSAVAGRRLRHAAATAACAVALWPVVTAATAATTATATTTATPTKDPDPGTLRYPPNAPQLNAIQVAVARQLPLPAGDAVNGRITYDENVTARIVSPVLGRVTALRAEIGARVQRNTVLAQVDSPDLAQAQSDYTKAIADQRHKQATLDRTRQLAESQTASRRDVEAADADLLTARSETERAAQKLRNLQALPHDLTAIAIATAGSGGGGRPGESGSGTGPDRSANVNANTSANISADLSADIHADGRYAVRSPIAGILVDKQINPGMEVRPDLPAPLYTVTDPTRLWVIADVPERTLARVHPGEAVDVQTDAWPGEHYAGKVEVVLAAVDPASRRVQARCSVRNPGGRLKADMFARVSFVTDPSVRGVQVPNSALVLQGSQHVVIVETQPGVFARRNVTIGVAGADTSYLTAGLADGEKVVSDGALLLLSEFPVAHAR